MTSLLPCSGMKGDSFKPKYMCVCVCVFANIFSPHKYLLENINLNKNYKKKKKKKREKIEKWSES